MRKPGKDEERPGQEAKKKKKERNQIRLTSLHHQMPAASLHDTRPQFPGPGPLVGVPDKPRRYCIPMRMSDTRASGNPLQCVGPVSSPPPSSSLRNLAGASASRRRKPGLMVWT